MRQIVLAATLLMISLVAPAQACTKVVRWNDDGPYFFKANDSEIHGFSADLTREILRRIGCEARFVEMPWARALIELEQGHIDIVSRAVIKPERQRFAHFSKIMGQSRHVLFMSAAAARKYSVKRLQDLAGTDFRLGVQIGVFYGEEFDALSSGPEFRKLLKPVTVRRNGWRMMALGRLDGMIADTAIGMSEIAQLDLSGTILPSSVAVNTEPATYAFSKRTTTPEFVEKFDQAYSAMLANHSHQKLVEKYLRGFQFSTQ